MNNKNSVSWSVNMPMNQMSDLDSKLRLYHGVVEQLSAPLLKFGSVLRPSLFGAKHGTFINSAQVTVEHFPGECSIIGLQFPGDIAEFIGRPVAGYSNENSSATFFGDAESVDSGLIRTEVIARGNGNSVMVGHFLRQSPRVLTGLASEEVTAFTVGCLSAIEVHRRKLDRSASSLVL